MMEAIAEVWAFWTSGFLVRALLFGLGVAVAMAPLGCVLIWRRMAFYTDILAHAALFGAVIGALMGVERWGNGVILLVVAGVLLAMPMALRTTMRLPNETVLVVMGYIAFVMAILLAEWISRQQRSVTLYGMLFGDILSVRWMDVYTVLILDVLIWGLVRWWLPVMTLDVISPRLSMIKLGRWRVRAARVVVAIAVVMVVALALQAVGALMASAMMIIPAALCRPWVATPWQMMIAAAAAGMIGVVGGLVLSNLIDLPTGPMIVGVLAVGFLGSALVALVRR